MCGVIGWVGDPSRFDAPTFRRVAMFAGMRGPHGHGFAYHRPSGDEVHHWPGPMRKDPPPRPDDCNALIGHTRLATNGRWWEVNDHQPLACGPTFIAHNGVIYNEMEIRKSRSLPEPNTGTDSEVLAQLIATSAGELSERVASAVAEVDHRSPLVLLVMENGEVCGIRREGTRLPAHPLFELVHEGGVYVSSWRLPGAKAIPEGKVVRWVS